MTIIYSYVNCGDCSLHELCELLIVDVINYMMLSDVKPCSNEFVVWRIYIYIYIYILFQN